MSAAISAVESKRRCILLVKNPPIRLGPAADAGWFPCSGIIACLPAPPLAPAYIGSNPQRRLTAESGCCQVELCPSVGGNKFGTLFCFLDEGKTNSTKQLVTALFSKPRNQVHYSGTN
eukprot:1837153-Rhodomonas_salina.1